MFIKKQEPKFEKFLDQRFFPVTSIGWERIKGISHKGAGIAVLLINFVVIRLTRNERKEKNNG
jgi:hypothetical protein